jgi:hypothetical protein
LVYWNISISKPENLDTSFPLLKAAYKCTKHLYEGKQPSWYGSVKHILQNMPSLTNFLTDKTSSAPATDAVFPESTLVSSYFYL